MKATTLFAIMLLFGILPAFAAQHTIQSSGFTFSPADLSVNPGDTVIFNLASMHDAREVTFSTWKADGSTSNGGFDVPFGGGSIVLTTPGTYYYVCVPHVSLGMKGTITVETPADPPPPAPLLLLPPNHFSIDSTATTLLWRRAAGATSYHLQLAEDSLFSVVLADDSTLTDTSKQIISIQHGRRYYWHVCGTNVSGTGPYSSTWWFLLPVRIIPGTVAVATGWNMISVPVAASDLFSGTLFPNAISKPFEFHGGYIVQDTLSNGSGYWLKFPSDTNITITGGTIETDTVAVNAGWNMIGSITQPVPKTALISIPGGIISTNFFEYIGTYHASDTLRPGFAYWVKVNQAGSIILSSPPGQTRIGR